MHQKRRAQCYNRATFVMKGQIDQFLMSLPQGVTGLTKITRVSNKRDANGNDTGEPQYQGEFAEVINLSGTNNGISALGLANLDDARFKRGARRNWILISVTQAMQVAKNSGITLEQEQFDNLQIKESLFVGASDPFIKHNGVEHYFKVQVVETFEMDEYQSRDPEGRCKRAGANGPIIYGDNNGTKSMIFSNTNIQLATKNESGEYIKKWNHQTIEEFVEEAYVVVNDRTEAVDVETGELITDMRL